MSRDITQDETEENDSRTVEELQAVPLTNGGWAIKISRCDFYIDVKNPQRSVLFNPTTGAMETNIKEQIIVRALLPSQKAEYYSMNVKLAKFHYDPYAVGPLTKDEEGAELFNVYQPPIWRRDNYFKGTPLPPAPPLPDLIERYLNHYTDGNAASKEYVLDWSANLLHRRNFTFKTSVGDAGVGKGKYGDIMRLVVGPSNFVKVRDEIFRSKFNGQLKNKQLVHVDEFSIEDKESADRCKDLANSKIEIESKGVDAEEIENHASFFFSSNRMDSVKIEPSDRRFSIIQLTDTSLLKHFTLEEIRQLEDPTIIEQFALFLWYRNVDINSMYTPFRSARFEDIREAGLNGWETYMVETLLPQYKKGARLDLPFIQNDLKANLEHLRAAPGRARLEEFTKKFPEYIAFRRDGETGVRYIEIFRAFKYEKPTKEEK